ncbi:MAG: hypothetical protein PUB89_03700 [Oscillospiraceae bacterium]|nr:hypothetical protein [Oscillospiraceae bacterium]
MKEYKYNTVSEVLDEIAEKINSKEILTQDWLEEIISEVSVIDNEGVFGKKTVSNFYTGGAGAYDPLKYRTINNTTVAELMSNRNFIDDVISLIMKANDVDEATAQKLANDYINSSEVFENFKPTGIKSKETAGPWAIASRNFALV